MKFKLLAAGLFLMLAGVAGVFVLGSHDDLDRDTLTLSGNVEVTEVDLGFRMAGRIEALFTDEGETVSRGKRIALLDNAENESLVMQNKASIRTAEVQREKTKADLERAEALFRQGVMSPQQREGAKAAYEAAVAQLQLARASLKTAEIRLKDTVLYTPLSGVVLSRNAEEGETIAAGVPVFSIGDLEHPWVKVFVKEDRLGQVKIGQRAEVRTDSYPGKRYEGTVIRISSEAEFTPKNVQTTEERVKLVFGVKVKVGNVNNELKPGMPVDVRIFLK